MNSDYDMVKSHLKHAFTVLELNSAITDLRIKDGSRDEVELEYKIGMTRVKATIRVSFASVYSSN